MTMVFYSQPEPDEPDSNSSTRPDFSLVQPDLSGWTSYKVPESLTGALDVSKFNYTINFETFKNLDKLSDILKTYPSLTMQWKEPIVSEALAKQLQNLKAFKSPLQDYIAAEDRLGKQIKAMSQALYKPNATIMAMMEQQKLLIEFVEKTDKHWQHLNKPILMDGMFTLPNYVVQSKSYEIGNWANKYNQMYLRIAEELRRQRIELSSMLEVLKRSPAVEELYRLMLEHELVCQLADGVHQRLCEVEKLTSTRSTVTVGFVDEFLAELRLDHGIMDDSLARIGEMPASELIGQNPIVTRTWYRLRLFSSELRRIDDDLSWLFQQILD